jgi:hypothetical protein
VAAVELLIAHAVWLGRNDFVDRFVDTAGDLAWVRWRAAAKALDVGRLPCSGSEAQVLRIAASLAAGVGVDLGEAVTGLDEDNIGLIAVAVLRANGRGDVAAGVGGVEGR